MEEKMNPVEPTNKEIQSIFIFFRMFVYIVVMIGIDIIAFFMTNPVIAYALFTGQLLSIVAIIDLLHRSAEWSKLEEE